MKITPTMARELQQAAQQQKAPNEGAGTQARSDVVELGSLQADGRVKVILKGEAAEGLFKNDGELSSKYGVKFTRSLPVIHGAAATVDAVNLQKLIDEAPRGVEVFLDTKRHIPEVPEKTEDPTSRPAQPKSDNAIPSYGVNKLWDRGFNGQGVGIAVIDTGVYPHQDFGTRLVAFQDFVNQRPEAYDDQGHGTHVAGDAAGDGTASEGRFKGSAPAANIIGLKVLDENGSGYDSTIIEAVQWAIENREQHNIRVMNLSLGGPIGGSYKEDPLAMALEAAVENGIVACVAAGNEGPGKETVGTPANAPHVVSVGAMNDNGTLTLADDAPASFSSRGPSSFDGLRKPEIMSPGVRITAANAPGSQLDRWPGIPHVGTHYITISGTSMATPILAGVVADLIQANPTMTPAQVKRILLTTADKLANVDRDTQGYGTVDPQQALDRALEAKQA